MRDLQLTLLCWIKWGDNAFNLAIPGETVTDSYYLLMESNRNNNVKRVIYDIDYQY